MAALDYGYEVTIAQNAVFDPNGVATNQWQRQVAGNTNWEGVGGGETTYTISPSDRASKIRLKQSLNGADAYSNQLAVTSELPPPPSSPCDAVPGIGDPVRGKTVFIGKIRDTTDGLVYRIFAPAQNNWTVENTGTGQALAINRSWGRDLSLFPVESFPEWRNHSSGYYLAKSIWESGNSIATIPILGYAWTYPGGWTDGTGWDPTNSSGRGIAGYNDWYVPATAEANLLFRAFWSGQTPFRTDQGENPYSEPPLPNYSLNDISPQTCAGNAHWYQTFGTSDLIFDHEPASGQRWNVYKADGAYYSITAPNAAHYVPVRREPDF